MLRRFVPIAVTLSAAALATQPSCIALLCYQDEPCAGEVGGGSDTSGATTSTGETSATSATGGAGGAGGTGGAGGQGCSADLTADPLNCGACGVDCGGAICADGVCGAVSLDLLPNATTLLGPVHVRSDTTVLVPAWQSCASGDGACILAVPAAFEGAETPLEIQGAPDVFGMWGRGPLRSYYAAQSSRTILACVDDACTSTTFSTGSHFNGPAPLLGGLFALETGPNARGVKIDLDGAGNPTGSAPVDFFLLETLGEGPHQMFPVEASSELVFTTFRNGGCAYREEVSNVGAEIVAQCAATLPGFPADGPTAAAVDASGEAFVLGTVPGPPYAFVGADLTPIGTTIVQPPLAVDDRFLYARAADGTSDGMVIIDRGSAMEIARLGAEPIGSIDASHPDFVFFTPAQGAADLNRLYRWRKKAP